MKNFIWGSRRRKIVAALSTAALVGASTAIAAFLLYSGADGSGNGTFGPASVVGAITLTGTSTPVITGPGQDVNLTVSVQNNDPLNTQQFATLTGVFSSSVPACVAHLSIIQPYELIGVPLSGGQFVPNSDIGIRADASTPSTCAGATWSVAFAGTTVQS